MTIRALLVFTTTGVAGSLIGTGLAWLAAGAIPLTTTQRSFTATEAEESPPPPDPLLGGLFPPVVDAPTPPLGGGPEEQPCATGWRLVGALLDRTHPERSFAAVHTPEGARLVARYTRHEELTVWELGADRAVLEREDGSRCEVRMFDARADPTPTLPAIPARPPMEENVGIERVSAHHYRVDRSLLRRVATMRPRASFLPVRRGGVLAGVRLTGVGREPLLRAAGAQDGDILVAVDGENLGDADVALAAYGRLRSGRPVRLTVEREGRPLDLTFEIAP